MPEPIEGNAPAQPVAPAAPVPQPAPQAPAPAPELPEAPSRTREQFEKLLDSNRRLFEYNEQLRHELDEKRQVNRTYEPIQNVPQPARQTQQQVNPQDFFETDPVTGETFLNEQRLRTRIEELEKKSSRAEQAVNQYIKTSEEREIERQNREAFSAYPELNPDATTHDPDFNRQVRGALFDSMYNAEEYGGRPYTFKEAADYVKQRYQKPAQPGAQPDAETARKEAEKAAAEGRAAKAQGSAQIQAQPSATVTPPEVDEDIEKLRMDTRRGDNEALARRLIHTEHIYGPNAERAGGE